MGVFFSYISLKENRQKHEDTGYLSPTSAENNYSVTCAQSSQPSSFLIKNLSQHEELWACGLQHCWQLHRWNGEHWNDPSYN